MHAESFFSFGASYRFKKMNRPIFGILLLLASFNNIAANIKIPDNTTGLKDHKELLKGVEPTISPSILTSVLTTTSEPVTSTITSTTTSSTTVSSTTVSTSTSTTPTPTSTTPAPTSKPTSASTTASPTPTPKNTTANPTSNSPISPATSPIPNTFASTTLSSVSVKGRHFDGLSFMGGIILTTCLVGLSVGSYKFYRIKTEQSYLTL